MEEKKITPKMKEENEVTITVVSEENNPAKQKRLRDSLIYNYTRDISLSGVGIQTHILLPVDTLINLEFTSTSLRQQINAFGKVKWVKVTIEDESYGEVEEFIDTPGEAIERIEDYISWKLKSKKPEFIKKELSSLDSGYINIPESKKVPAMGSDNENIAEPQKVPEMDSGYINIPESKKVPAIGSDNENIAEPQKVPEMDSGYINIPESKKIPAMGSDKENIAEPQKVPEMDSGYINIPESKKIPAIGSDKENIVETKKAPSIKNKQWIDVAVISTSTIILILILANIFGPIVLDFIYPDTNKKNENNFVHNSIKKKLAMVPAPPNAASTAKGAPSPSSAPEVTEKIKVIGNSDSKMYHLPGMKYYDAVKAYHRVEFDSETDAIEAGYQKAPR